MNHRNSKQAKMSNDVDNDERRKEEEEESCSSEAHVSSSSSCCNDEDSSSTDQLEHNKRKLCKVMEKLRKSCSSNIKRRTVCKWCDTYSESGNAIETKIHYHRPYHNSWRQRFLLSKQFIRS